MGGTGMGSAMPTDQTPGASTTLAADDAFAVLGDETRLQVLQALGEAEGPLAYSTLFDRVEYDDTSNFSYHLDRLVGHFVRKTEAGYVLRLAGRRVVEAVHSGAVTENPVVDRTAVDMPCMYCGGPLEIGYHDEVVVLYCSDCSGDIERVKAAVERWPIPSTDIVGYVSLPPAGVYDRTPDEILDAAGVGTISGVQSLGRGVCPRCSALVERSLDICDDHDSGDGFCDACGHQFGTAVTATCTNCIFRTRSPFPTQALANTDLMGFMIDHGIDPISPDGFHLAACEEEIRSADPPRASFTFTADGDSITLEVDEDFPTIDVTRG